MWYKRDMLSLRSFEDAGHTTFSSLTIRNFRFYFLGQGVSMLGTWMQSVALGWLVLDLTGSGTQLGIVTALQFLPLLLFGPWGGLFVDRRDTRTVLIATQWAYAGISFLMSALIFLGIAHLSVLYLFALAAGFVRMVDNPGRHTLIPELVGNVHIKNATSLNSLVNNLGRVLGPVAAGALLATTSDAFCFFINAFTYLFMIAMLRRMEPSGFFIAEKGKREAGQVAAALRYVAATPRLLHILIAAGLVGTFVFEWQVSLALLARQEFAGTVALYADLMSSLGVGAVVGSLYAASRKGVTVREIITHLACATLSITCASLAPRPELSMLFIFLTGIFTINIAAQANTFIQLETRPEMRGRVMALWSMAMLGSTPIGGPIVGAIGEFAGARWGLGIAAITSCITALYLIVVRRSMDAAAQSSQGERVY